MKIIFLTLLFALSACSGEGGGDWGAGSKDKLDPVSMVSVAPAALGTVSAYITTSAVVESVAQADVYPQATGRVLKVFKDDGDPVKKGDVLAIIENVSLGANADRTESERERQAAETTKLRALFEKGAISEKELSDAEFLLTSANTSAKEAKHTFGETKLRAPFDGVVAVREVRVGETASGGKRAFQVVDLNRLRVVAALPEREMPRVSVGQTVALASAYNTAHTATGQVVRLSPVVDANTGTFRVTIALQPSQNTLRPGQFVEVKIEVEQHVAVLTVPRPAVIYEDGMPVIYRMVDPPVPEETEEEEVEPKAGFWWFWADDEKTDPEETEEEEAEWPKMAAERVAVELGLMDDQLAEVITGVELGESIVVIGQSNLMDGALIRTPEMLPPSEKSAEKDADEPEEAG
jgi:membrane fusion protein (multidrug efflux system)